MEIKRFSYYSGFPENILDGAEGVLTKIMVERPEYSEFLSAFLKMLKCIKEGRTIIFTENRPITMEERKKHWDSIKKVATIRQDPRFIKIVEESPKDYIYDIIKDCVRWVDYVIDEQLSDIMSTMVSKEKILEEGGDLRKRLADLIVELNQLDKKYSPYADQLEELEMHERNRDRLQQAHTKYESLLKQYDYLHRSLTEEERSELDHLEMENERYKAMCKQVSNDLVKQSRLIEAHQQYIDMSESFEFFNKEPTEQERHELTRLEADNKMYEAMIEQHRLESYLRGVLKKRNSIIEEQVRIHWLIFCHTSIINEFPRNKLRETKIITEKIVAERSEYARFLSEYLELVKTISECQRYLDEGYSFPREKQVLFMERFIEADNLRKSPDLLRSLEKYPKDWIYDVMQNYFSWFVQSTNKFAKECMDYILEANILKKHNINQ